MDLITLLSFTVAYAIVVAVPGPGVAAIVARALGGGFWSAVPMVVGILLGDLAYLTFAAFGLAAIATHFSAVFTVIRYASALYLAYIAWKFWTAKPGSEQVGPKTEEHWAKTLLAGLSLTLGNPKTIVFYLALLPTVVPLDKITATGFLELTAIVIVVLMVIGLAYAALAAGAREFFRSSTALRRLNRVTGGVLALAAAAVLVR
ncbi:MAG TPA: LysE family translocator [Devosiaceae bacterium]|nr:LysE family translocator [Devosiaceae bacterium]